MSMFFAPVGEQKPAEWTYLGEVTDDGFRPIPVDDPVSPAWEFATGSATIPIQVPRATLRVIFTERDRPDQPAQRMVFRMPVPAEATHDVLKRSLLGRTCQITLDVGGDPIEAGEWTVARVEPPEEGQALVTFERGPGTRVEVSRG